MLGTVKQQISRNLFLAEIAEYAENNQKYNLCDLCALCEKKELDILFFDYYYTASTSGES